MEIGTPIGNLITTSVSASAWQLVSNSVNVLIIDSAYNSLAQSVRDSVNIPIWISVWHSTNKMTWNWEIH